MSRSLALGQSAASEDFLQAVRDGLRRRPRAIPPRFLYDARGSEIFERICELDEYYLTRTELEILRTNIEAIVDALGERCVLVEYGSGASTKTRILLDHLRRPAAYVPIDIAEGRLAASAAALRTRYPGLEVLPLCLDYGRDHRLPERPEGSGRRVIYFPGSSLGNFEPEGARAFLRRVARLCGPDGGLLIGIDLVKDTKTLERAYADRAGVSAEFGMNLLVRMQSELGAELRLDRFRYRAVYEPVHARIEMGLVSLEDQAIRIGGEIFPVPKGEQILTEYSHKYSLGGFRALAEGAGMDVRWVWTDPQKLFSVQYLTPL